MWLIETLQCLFVSCSSQINSESLASSVNINRSSGHNYSSIPVVCWHGVNDDAKSCDMIFRTLSEDVYTLSIQIGESLEVDKYNSVFMEMMEQVFFSYEVTLSITHSDVFLMSLISLSCLFHVSLVSCLFAPLLFLMPSTSTSSKIIKYVLVSKN